jgi:hypothetical protein
VGFEATTFGFLSFPVSPTLLVKGFARRLPLVDTTRGGLYGAEIAGECVVD